MADQIAFGGNVEFADNPEPRCPCVLLLDVSGSMAGSPIAELNSGLTVLKDELSADPLALKRVELAIVTFGPLKTEMDFQSASTFYPPTLVAQGDTPMGAAILHSLDLLRKRKDEYKTHGIHYYRPWVFLITDGGPTDAWQAAATAVRGAEQSKAVAFFAVGVKNANMEILRQISVREPLMLDGLRFGDLFSWLSASLKQISISTPGTEVTLPQTGWTSV
jgi:uncharacterized protein YegL